MEQEVTWMRFESREPMNVEPVNVDFFLLPPATIQNFAIHIV